MSANPRSRAAALSVIFVLVATVSLLPSIPRAQAAPAEPFTVVVLPDLQNYGDSTHQQMIRQQADWVVSTRTQLNTAFVIQVGDLVGTWDSTAQWGWVSEGLRPLDSAGVPYAVLPGNHDLDPATWSIDPYNQYFGVNRFANAAWTPSTARYGGYLGQNQFGADAVDRQNMDNYALFTAGGRDFLSLNLEWEAPAPVLEWADRVLKAYPDRIVLLATHSYLHQSGSRRTTTQRPGGTSGEQLWQTFVSTHCSVRLVVNGHDSDVTDGEANRTDTNTCGEPVHQILTDYQDRPNGGDGWLRTYTFDPTAATLHARTYSPVLGAWETDADSDFTLPFALGSAQPPAGRVVAADAFGRTVSNGWGTADQGGPWTVTGGSAAFTVANGTGNVTLAKGNTRTAALTRTTSTDATVNIQLATDVAAAGGAANDTIIGRLVGSASYSARARFEPGGIVRLYLLRITTTETALASAYTLPGTYTPGAVINLEVSVTGTSPTTISAKAWYQGQPTPTTWQRQATDSTTSLQTSGTIAIRSSISSTSTVPTTTLTHDNLKVVTDR